MTDRRLALVEKLYQKSIWEKVKSVADGKRLNGPLVVELDPTTFCDMACPECISSPILNNGKFKNDRLIEICQEFIDVGVRAVIFIGGGEPLLHPSIGRAIEKLGIKKVAVGITTNGTLIDRYLVTIAEYASWVRVSVDAASPECYEKFRPHRSRENAFTKVINNMRQLAQVKRGELGFSYLLMSRLDINGKLVDTNFHEVLEAGKLAKDIGCDYFEVKPVYNLRHFLIAQPSGLKYELQEQIAELDNLEDDVFKVISPTNLDVILQSKPLVEPKHYSTCLIAELRTLVTPNGAYICPYHRGNNTANYGDPALTEFSVLWNSEKRKEVTSKINPSRDCQFHCIRHNSNLALFDIGYGIESCEVKDDFDLFL